MLRRLRDDFDPAAGMVAWRRRDFLPGLWGKSGNDRAAPRHPPGCPCRRPGRPLRQRQL